MPVELLALGFGPGNPVPRFTVYDILRTARFFFQQFSTTQVPEYQLENLVALETLSAKYSSFDVFAILNDLDPLSSMIESQTLMVPDGKCKSFDRKELKGYSIPGTKGFADPDFHAKAAVAHDLGKKIKDMKERNRKYVPGLGSNGQAIAPCKSASGNALLRIAPQPNMNHPSDFYEVRVENDQFTADYFVPVAIPFGIGVFNHMGLSAQTGHLPTNDFLFESTDNIVSSRQETVYVKGENPVTITVSRSKSNGWVIVNPAPGLPGTMITLRSGFFDRQLQGLNVLNEFPFTHNVKQLLSKLKNNPKLTSDIVGFMGQCADSCGNIGAYHATSWIKLPRNFDRRIPQGIISLNPAATNCDYIKGRSKPLTDMNTKQGFYNGWNTLFSRKAQASGDTLDGGGPGLNRGYWLENVLKSKKKISFDDLEHLTVVEAVANSITAFNPVTGFGADLFTPLFKKKFLKVLAKQKNPTANQKATLELLKDFEGSWFEGDTAQIRNTKDVSDRFILASTWLLNFAGRILNPVVAGTKFQVDVGGVGNPLPNNNNFGTTPFSNNLLDYGQGNLLARLLNTNCDNTVFYTQWLNGVDVDQAILDSLDVALTNLGGFAAQPWGKNKRPIYQFQNLILGTVEEMYTFNASGLYMIVEFSPEGVKRSKGVLPLGESGYVTATGSNPPYKLQPHNLDQFPLFVKFRTRELPTYLDSSSSSK